MKLATNIRHVSGQDQKRFPRSEVKGQGHLTTAYICDQKIHRTLKVVIV